MSSKLPQQLDWNMASNRWATILDPVIASPLSKAIILKNVELSTGANIINHKLGRKLQGYYITRMRDAFSEIYDTQETNSMPELTLLLNSSIDIVVDLVVY
jgi:hypothetical protein